MKIIKYIVFDIDGTLTDGKIYISDKGEMMKAFISFPDNIKFEALKNAIEYYVRKFGIFTLRKVDPFIGGQQITIIKYY